MTYKDFIFSSPKKAPSFSWLILLRFSRSVINCPRDLKVKASMSLSWFRFSSLKNSNNQESAELNHQSSYSVFNRFRLSKKSLGIVEILFLFNFSSINLDRLCQLASVRLPIWLLFKLLKFILSYHESNKWNTTINKQVHGVNKSHLQLHRWLGDAGRYWNQIFLCTVHIVPQTAADFRAILGASRETNQIYKSDP